MNPLASIRVTFLLQRPETWLNVRGLWRGALADDRFAPSLLVLPYHHLKPQKNPEHLRHWIEILDREGARYEIWQEEDGPDGTQDADVVVFTVPYDRERPSAFHFDRIARQVPSTVYLPYGLTMGGGPHNQRLQYAQPTQMRSTVVYARSQFEREAYRMHCPSGDRHVHALGHPRLDELGDLSTFAVDQELLQEIGDRFPVLWNSHFSFARRDRGLWDYSTFDIIGGRLLEYAIHNPRVALIWRPHPHLFPTLVALGILQWEDLGALEAELRDAGVILDRRPDYRHAFAASQALVTDLGSFLLEYLAMERPILYTHNPDGPGLNEEGKALVAHLPVAQNAGEVIAFIERARTRHGNVSARQDLAALRRRFLPLADGNSAARILEHIATSRDHIQHRSAKVLGSSFKALPRMTAGLEKLNQEKADPGGWEEHIGSRIRHLRQSVIESLKRSPFLFKVATALERRRTNR